MPTHTDQPNGAGVNLREYFTLWIQSLEKYIEERFRASDSAVMSALTATEKQNTLSGIASEKAIDKAEAAQKDYNQRSNEFRGQLDDQAKRLISRTEVESAITSLKSEMMAEINTTRSMLIGVKTELASTASRNTDDIKALQLIQANLAGKASQTDVNTVRIIAFIGLALSIIGTIMAIARLLVP